MCTSTVALADAVPAHPVTAIGDSTVVKSAIGTSVPLVATQPAGPGEGDGLGVGVTAGAAWRLRLQESMRPTSPPAASCTRSFQVPLADSEERLTTYVWSMLRVLPPARLCSV